MSRQPELVQREARLSTTVTAAPAPAADEILLRRLRAGDRAAFAILVRRHQDAMLRLAGFYVPSRAIAEEVVQETWAAVLEGLPRFEGRSSIKTWIFAILINRAKSLGVRERRSIPFSALAQRASAASGSDGAEGLNRQVQGDPSPRVEEQTPERSLQLREALRHVTRGMAELPSAQRDVVTLMGVWGKSADETCSQLKDQPGQPARAAPPRPCQAAPRRGRPGRLSAPRRRATTRGRRRGSEAIAGAPSS